MKLALVLPIVVVLAIPMRCGAQGSPEYTMIGAGRLSCGTWVKYRDEKAASDIQQWILGFLSGAGFVGSPKTDPLQGTDGLGVFAWMDTYCRNHPLDTIEAAGVAFIFARRH